MFVCKQNKFQFPLKEKFALSLLIIEEKLDYSY